jgi:hypothetical protein
MRIRLLASPRVHVFLRCDGLSVFDNHSRSSSHQHNQATRCSQLNIVQIDTDHGICPNKVSFNVQFLKGFCTQFM